MVVKRAPRGGVRVAILTSLLTTNRVTAVKMYAYFSKKMINQN
jgi:hypothetical protein